MHTIKANNSLGKLEKYKALKPQIKSLLEAETDLIANLSNFCGALKQTFNWWWVGFYIVKNNQLVLGPYQGPVACTRINFGKGVCGTVWQQQQTIIVDDVSKFPGHIACSEQSKSEIVVPVFHKNKVVAVLDVDSEYYNNFDETDKKQLEYLVTILNFEPII
ncbi:MAG: GAF domain-containing protein [Bacteroidia bacterium]